VRRAHFSARSLLTHNARLQLCVQISLEKLFFNKLDVREVAPLCVRRRRECK
jgi:hypothetical protein